MSVSVSDLVDAALVLIDGHNGKVPGNKLPLLYQLNRHFRRIISDHGGLKKFCESREELEFVDGLPSGWIQKRNTVQNALRVLQEMLGQEGDQASNQPALATSLPGTAGDLIKFRELSPEAVAANNSSCSVTLKVSEIRWSQDCIKTHFKNGEALVDVVKELIESPMLLERLPSMDVLEIEGKWFAINGNRRLWVLKEYARCICCDLTLCVPVYKGSPSNLQYMLKARFTTPNNGVHVDVVLEHRTKEYLCFHSMALALRHGAGKGSDKSPCSVSSGYASTTAGSSSDEGEP